MKIQLKSEITCPNCKNKDAIITDFTVKEKILRGESRIF